MKKSDIKILVVDDEEINLLVLSKSLKKLGYSVTTTTSAIKGAEILKTEKFNLVLTDLNMPEISGLDFLLWIKKHSPQSHVIIMTAFGSKETKEFAEQKGALTFLEKPVNISVLEDYIEVNIVNKGFSGNISHINLYDFIKMITFTNAQKLISITRPDTKKTGYIYFDKGNVIHAEFENLTGEDAFLKIMGIKNGIFTDLAWTEPSKTTINQPADNLLLKSAKLNDEGSSDISLKHSKGKILVVDDDHMTLMILEKHLSKQGFSITTAESAIVGAEILRKEYFELVITDINMPEINGLEFLLWIKQNSPKSDVIMITAVGSNEIKQFANQKGAVNYFEKPINLKEFDIFINKLFTEKGFSGNIQDIQLIDFIQIISLSKTNKLISVLDPYLNKAGLIYIKNGSIIHAECDNLIGQEAFNLIMSLESGMFSDVPWMEPPEITINSPVSKLLLQMAKKQDEKRLETIEENEAGKGTAVVRARPKYLERALDQQNALATINRETDEIKRLTIYESGVALGIVIGKSNKADVVEAIKSYTSINLEAQLQNQMFTIDDLSLMILFNELGIVEEMNFGRFYKGKTESGIALNDPLENAFDVYGKPKISTIKGAVWENIAFFSNNNHSITSIRVRDSAFFQKVQTKQIEDAPERKLLSEPERKQITAGENNTQEVVMDDVSIKEIFKEQLKHLKDLAGKSEPFATPEKLTINEDDGKAVGITINKTTREEVKQIMKNYSESFNYSNSTNHEFIYSDISLRIKFNSKGIVEEFNFGSLYKGLTKRGLGIGDTIEKAVELYGSPRFQNSKNVFWNNMAIFCEDTDIITEIRLLTS